MSDAYVRAERVIARIVADPSRGDRLATLAARDGLSAAHTQRTLRAQIGLSPKRLAAVVRVGRADALLRDDASVLDAALAIGLSGPGRLHDQFIVVEALSPGEAKAGGAGVALRRGVGGTPFGPAAIAWTARGVCRLAFLDDAAGETRAAFAARLRAAWPAATATDDDAGAAALLARAFADAQALPLRVVGTSFQVAVWRALLEIPPGALTTYERIAQAIGRAGAARAVGNAVGDNPVAWLIPCHRVIRASGALGGYRWGLARKSAILDGEARLTPR